MPPRDIKLYDVHLRVPDEWRDETVVLLQGKDAGSGYPPKFLISRHKRDAQTNLEMFAAGVMERFAKQSEGFEVIANRPYRLHEHAAHLLSFRWSGPRGPVTQYQIFVPGLLDTVLCLCAAALTSEFPAYETVFNGLLASIQLPLDPP